MGIKMNNIFIIGAGLWGITLANYLASKKNKQIFLIPGRQDSFCRVEKLKLNKKIDNRVIIKSCCKDIVKSEDILIIATSSKHVRKVAKKLSQFVKKNLVISASKGIEKETFKTMTEVIESELPSARVAVISGPTIAKEIQLGYPAMLVVAGDTEEIYRETANLFESDQIKIITEKDKKSVEYSGAVKNIVAIASGIYDGIGAGCNQKASVIVGIIDELLSLFKQIKVSEKIFFGISGLGDILATATSSDSRNYRMGKLLGEGLSKFEAEQKIGMCIEGEEAIETILSLMKQTKINSPNIVSIFNFINNKNRELSL